MITGINHITLSVRDLHESFAFYVDLLMFRPRVRWSSGAYLTAGDLWLALAVDTNVHTSVSPEYSHLAFTVDPLNFQKLSERIRGAGVREWQANSSEGDSIYFLDPSGHKLEIHYSTIESRLADAKKQRWADFEFFD